jgi:hypothetical protein
MITNKTVALTGALFLALAVQVAAQCTELISGLQRPIALTQSKKDNLLVSESGISMPNTGRISIVDLAGTRRTLVTGLPSGISFEANAPSGPDGLFLRGRTLYLAIGVGDAVLAGPTQGTTRPNPSPSSPLFSSILAIHFSAAVEKNTQGFTLTLADHETLASGQPVTLSNGGGDTITIEMIVNFPNFTADPTPSFAENVRNVNPFGLVALGNLLYVTDGGQNLIWRVDLSARQFSVLTTFARIPNPQFNANPPPPSLGGPFLEAVPTGIEFADGQIVVTLFRGFPFPAGASAVLRVDPLTGSQSAFISGLKTAIDVLPIRADDEQGDATKHLGLQHASGPIQMPPGLLLRFDTPAGPPTTLASCLTAPTAMTLDEKTGTLYVTELGGRIVAISVGAEAQDADTGLAPTVRNISSRGRVETGENVLIGGFIVGEGTGGGAIKVAVRAIGPTLGNAAVAEPLQDPTLTLHDGNGIEIARNDNWKGDPGQTSQQAEIEAAGLAPGSDSESAVIATLAPGNYTGIVRGKEDNVGVALVEVFHVQ